MMLGKKKAEKQEKTESRVNEEEIRVAAYFRWRDRGEHHGADLDDWLKAERSFLSPHHGKNTKGKKAT